MFINKIGQYHLDYGINNQDYGFDYKGNTNVKCVFDGCSQGKHSEVGVKLYTHRLIKTLKELDSQCLYFIMQSKLHDIMQQLLESLEVKEDINFILDNFCFTILMCIEDTDSFRVDHIGDGYIILQKHDDTFDYIELKNKYPDGNEYLIYNFIDNKYLTHYKEGVILKSYYLQKEEYKNIGVATDGIRYILDNPTLKQEFEQLLLKGKENMIKLFINRNQKICQDDITISF